MRRSTDVGVKVGSNDRFEFQATAGSDPQLPDDVFMGYDGLLILNLPLTRTSHRQYFSLNGS